MPRGKKNSETVTYAQTKGANNITGTEGGKMRVYASKPKKASATDAKSPEQVPAAVDHEVLERVSYELTDKDHPIERIDAFVHCTIYWIPNSEQFMVENVIRGEGKAIIAAPVHFLTDENPDLEAINAIFGMHFGEESRGMFDVIRQGITQDTDNIKVFQLCELGLIRDKNKVQYTYIAY